MSYAEIAIRKKEGPLRPGGMSVILERKGGEKMKKGSFVLRLFLYVSLVSLLWLGGYMALSELFSVEEPKKDETGETNLSGIQLPDPKTKQWSVLVVADEEGEVTDFWVRYGDFRADVLAFIEIPIDTKVELAAGGYEILKVHNPELPKLFMISDMCRIFSEETMCMAAEEIGTALLGVRPTESYIIGTDDYAALTKKDGGRIYFEREGSVEEKIMTLTANAITNDTAEEELVYWESYSDLDYIYYLRLPGRNGAQEYVPDGEKIAEMVSCLETGTFEQIEQLHQDSR